jgi:hypothetical protein
MNKPMLKSMKKKREEKKKKEREKDSPYIRIKGNHQKESHDQRSTKNI